MSTLWRFAVTGLIFTTLTGCNDAFTLEIDLPENFRIEAEAKYRQDKDQDCLFADKETRLSTSEWMGMGTYEFYPEPKLLSYRIPLTKRVKGCSLKLKAVSFEIWGKWAEHEHYPPQSNAFAGLTVTDKLYKGYPGMPESGVREFEARCTYLFRIMPKPNKTTLAKILDCQAVDDKGVIKRARPGGAVQRDQLAGRTVRLNVSLLGPETERPYFRNTWVKFPNGWKPCGGGDVPMPFCTDNQSEFKTFFFENDERECTLYPGCTE